MYLYNVSIIIEDSHHDSLVQWLKEFWLPSITQQDVKFLKMLHSPHEGHTYCVQFAASNEQEIQKFQEDFITGLQERIATVHIEKAFIFDSTMQYLDV